MILLAVLGLAALAVVALALREPTVAAVLMLIAMFMRLVLSPYAPVEPYLLAFAGMVASFLLWLASHRGQLPHLGWLEAFMILYVIWNIFSMIAPHELGAVYPATGETLSAYRFILTGTAIPFVMYVIGRAIYDTERTVRLLLWIITGLAAFSGLEAILQFHAPALVWPRYMIENAYWPGRANGIFNQPVVNGLTLIAGFVAAIVLLQKTSRSRWVAVGLAATVAVCAYGVYLTHTRVVWLAFLVAVIGALIVGSGMRRPFAITLGVMVTAVIINWNTFTSSDRAAGGVASTSEVDDRLNTIATSFWAAEQKPLFGWGIARFTAINTVHHQGYPGVPWLRGWGISSHLNELGILVELGAVGLVLWLAVVITLVVKLIRAVRSMPADGVTGRGLALLALIVVGVLLLSGTTVDLRFFDFPNALVFLLAGIAIGWADRHTAAPDPADRLPGGRSWAEPHPRPDGPTTDDPTADNGAAGNRTAEDRGGVNRTAGDRMAHV